MINHALDESQRPHTIPSIWRWIPGVSSLSSDLVTRLSRVTHRTRRASAGSHLPILWTTQSCWHRGQRLFCFTHRDMQQLWKEWLHSPQTTTQSSCLFSAWHLRQASITWTLQMAQVSHSTSQLHMATAFHFLRENILSPPDLEPALPECEFCLQIC